jgi:glycosyltransferase involved in cell wall biosynthesis
VLSGPKGKFAASMTITVFIPNYNHAHLIAGALNSLVAQTRQPDEIIVVDDASTDRSLETIETFATRLPQMRVLRNPKNLGVCATVNRALWEAQSSHIACLSADDWLEPTFIERTTSVMARFPSARFCVSQCVRYIEAEDRLVPHGPDSELGCWFAPSGPAFFTPDQFLALLDRGFVWLPLIGAVVDRDLFRAVGGCDPTLAWHADWFALYAIAARYGFAAVPEPLSIFRVAAASYSGKGMRDRRQQRAVCMAMYNKLKSPEFHDLYEAMRRHPAGLSPFMHDFILGLSARPEEWGFLVPVLQWWMKEVLHGRRPGALRDFVARLRVA